MGAAVRLDDAFRQFLNERGAKTVPLPVVTHLVTGCARVRLLALTLGTLPGRPGGPDRSLPPAVVTVRDEVAADFGADERWFEEFTGLCATGGVRSRPWCRSTGVCGSACSGPSTRRSGPRGTTGSW